MSDYGRIVTTNQGKNMVTESIRTKSAIIFTKISLGDGLLNGETIETMTGLKHRLMDGNVPKINHLGNGEIEAVSTVSNSELTAGFFARELGLFAKLGEEGEEQLFAYTNAGSNASYIPPNTSVDEKMLGIQLGVGDAIVQVNYQSHLYITYEQLEDGIAHHNNDANAHGGLLQNLKNQLSTHNTDISSHPAITDAIAKILGATDWQENPVATLKDIKNKLGEGGIVAQRFGESGFVKYANGFTIQWGKSDIVVARTIYDGASNFIIPFTFPPFVAVTNIAPATLDNDNWTSSAVKEITINSFTYMSAQNNVTSIRWGAIGF